MPSDEPAQRSGVPRRDFLGRFAAALLTPIALRGPRVWAGELRTGEQAPPAVLTTLDGRKISTPSLLGKVVILTFWASWCEPCREELPLLSRYAARHGASNLRVLGFSLDSRDSIPDVRKVARTLSFPVGLLGDSSAPGYGRIWRLPVNFTIDRVGRLVENGWKEKKPGWTAERLEQVVTPLLVAASS